MLEFGSRRAQGADGAILGARAAYIGGCAGTACTISDELYGVYAGDAPELAYVELIYGENLPQTVTVFVRAADGTCLTRTSFVYNSSDYPEEIYMALPALADSFWYGLDTQVCALPEE